MVVETVMEIELLVLITKVMMMTITLETNSGWRRVEKWRW